MSDDESEFIPVVNEVNKELDQRIKILDTEKKVQRIHERIIKGVEKCYLSELFVYSNSGKLLQLLYPEIKDPFSDSLISDEEEQ